MKEEAKGVDAGGRYLTPWELKMQARTEKLLLTWGRYESVRRFMRKISKISTRFCYLLMLDQYLRWLREAKGVTMDPDELVRDNLECVYNSLPTDVKTKRRHTDWLDEYVNDHLLSRGVGTKRASTAAAVKVFYRRNDSQLVGDFSVAEGPAVTPDKALLADDVRLVLKTLPLQSRPPSSWSGRAGWRSTGCSPSGGGRSRSSGRGSTHSSSSSLGGRGTGSSTTPTLEGTR